MTRLSRSTALRLVALNSAVGVVALLLFAGILFLAAHDQLNRELDAVIEDDTHILMAVARDGGPGELRTAIGGRVGRLPDEHTILLFADAQFGKIEGNLPAWPLRAERAPGWYRVTIATNSGNAVEVRFLHSLLPDGSHLLVGHDVSSFTYVRQLFVLGIVGAAATVILFGICGGALLYRAVLARIDAIRRTTAAIVEGDLARRLPVRGSGSELDLLATTINGMLEQIEQLVQGVRNVSNAVAHDMRTPLAELRARLEALLEARPAAPAAFAEIEAAIGDIDRVIAMFNALLRLAEIDSGARRKGLVAVGLAPLVEEVTELYEPMAAEKSVSLLGEAAPGLATLGDQHLLAHALSNLVENALKYVPAGSRVEITARREPADTIALIVADNGPGIPDGEREKATERFYRGDASRGTPGFGLGLSTVAAVAKLHGGRLELADNRPGLRATLHLPALAATPAPAAAD